MREHPGADTEGTASMRFKPKVSDPLIPGLLPIWGSHGWIVDAARVDIADWERLQTLRFSLVKVGYPATWTGQPRKRTYLHHLVLGVPTGGMTVDHVNRDKLDNRRANLRVVTQRENLHNRGGKHERCWWRQQQAA